jgi:gluconokinase
MILIVMGVCGSGKTTIGEILSERLGWPFYDADNFHSAANKKKMNAGIPLTDEDRQSWLTALRDLIQDHRKQGKAMILACSALKEGYRRMMSGGDPEVRFVYLHGSKELIAARLDARKGHYMNPGLLDSQFEALEEPRDAVVLEIDGMPEEIAGAVMEKLGLEVEGRNSGH